MKSLKQYITESVRSYNYTIKIAGEVDKNFLDMFVYNLNKFDPIEVSKPNTTVVQKDPYGFPNLSNQPVTIIKAKFRYPANEPMIQQVAQLLGYNVNYVRVIGTDFNDSINGEAGAYANEMSHNPLLLHPELEEAPGAKEASKQYAGSFLQTIAKQSEGSKIDIPYAGEKTKDAFDPFKPYLANDPRGEKSPMSTIKRPPKPETGATVSK